MITARTILTLAGALAVVLLIVFVWSERLVVRLEPLASAPRPEPSDPCQFLDNGDYHCRESVSEPRCGLAVVGYETAKLRESRLREPNQWPRASECGGCFAVEATHLVIGPKWVFIELDGSAGRREWAAFVDLVELDADLAIERPYAAVARMSETPRAIFHERRDTAHGSALIVHCHWPADAR